MLSWVELEKIYNRGPWCANIVLSILKFDNWYGNFCFYISLSCRTNHLIREYIEWTHYTFDCFSPSLVKIHQSVMTKMHLQIFKLSTLIMHHRGKPFTCDRKRKRPLCWRSWYTVNPLYNDILYNSKIRYDDNPICTKISGSCIFSVPCYSLGKHTFWIFVRIASPSNVTVTFYWI